MIVAAALGDAVGALVGVAIAGAVWLAFAFRSLRLKEAESAEYVGLHRWTGDAVRTRGRAVAFVVAWGLLIFVVNLLFIG
ncbi:MAG TPA: hypothetical protein VHH09_04985 [Acidimicrobiales bacterium]|nr:hypothetical protein [Acidimicrobiales bacterium]